MRAIDISEWQSDVDFNKVKASGIDCVIIRAGQGRETSQKDRHFETHYKNAKAVGLKIGVYWYSYAEGVEDAKREAAACLACIKGKSFDLPIYYDLEDKTIAPLGKITITAIALAFCSAVETAGYKAGVYANLNWFTNYIDKSKITAKDYSIWLAQWSNKADIDCDIWQYTSTGKVNGIYGSVDMNEIKNETIISNNDNNNVKILKSSYLRKHPYCDDETSKKLAKLKAKSIVEYISDEGYGWSKVKYNGLTGYVQNTRLNKSGLSAYPVATVTADVLNVRNAPNGKIVATLKQGKKVTVRYIILSGKNKGWCEIAYPASTSINFASGDFLKF